VLIYNKLHIDAIPNYQLFYNQVKSLLENLGYQTVTISYGSYNQSQYKELLSQVSCAIILSRSESQGIALAECWAMNVPTFCWDLEEPLHAEGTVYWPISSAPYLSMQTGAKWKNLDELKVLLNEFSNNSVSYSPRDWVLKKHD
jgi:hypothetical protein